MYLYERDNYSNYMLKIQILPLGLLVLGLASFKMGRFDEMFDWGIAAAGEQSTHKRHMLPSWAREVIRHFTF